MTVEDAKNNIIYVLVYNEAKNKENPARDKNLEKKNELAQEKKENATDDYKIAQSASFDAFASTVSKLAKKEIICFGMSSFQHWFNKVHTYTEKEFENWYETNLKN